MRISRIKENYGFTHQFDKAKVFFNGKEIGGKDGIIVVEADSDTGRVIIVKVNTVMMSRDECEKTGFNCKIETEIQVLTGEIDIYFRHDFAWLHDSNPLEIVTMEGIF